MSQSVLENGEEKMDPGIFCRTEAIGDHELYQGFTQDHSDLMGRMINFCRHWQNTFALHLQFLCDQLRGCPCKTFFNQAVWQNTYKPFIDEMHTWNRNLLVHLRDPKCLVENSEKFGEFQHRYLRLAASILEWQGRHAEHQENYLSQSLCTPCLETSERVHRQALNYLYFNRAPTLDIRYSQHFCFIIAASLNLAFFPSPSSQAHFFPPQTCR